VLISINQLIYNKTIKQIAMTISKNQKYAIIGGVVLLVSYTGYKMWQNSKSTLPDTPSVFNYKTFLNGKWKMSYSTPTDAGGVETGTITNGDTYAIDGGEVRKLINVSYDSATKTLTFTEVKPDGSEMPETKVKINETAKTMTGTNGGWNVVYTKG